MDELAAQADVVRTEANNGNLVMEDVPEIPASVVRDLNRYQNVRSAGFSDWTEDGEGEPIRRYAAFNEIDEARFVVDRIRRFVDAAKTLEACPLYIVDTPALPIAQLAARARRLKRTHGLDVLIVDYLQLLTGNERSGDSRVQEVSEITTGLKALAKELNVPVVALSQLNRSLEQRPNKRPVMSDLRESGAIEQDSDIVMFIYRDEYYNPETADRGITEVIVTKHRNGPVGTGAGNYPCRSIEFALGQVVGIAPERPEAAHVLQEKEVELSREKRGDRPRAALAMGQVPQRKAG